MLRLVLACFAWATLMLGAALPAPAAAQGRPIEIQCSSYSFQPARCAAPIGRAGFVKVLRITNMPCDQGRTWGWDAGGIWVTGNCRALFAAYPDRPAGGPPGGGYPGGGYPGGGNPGGGYPGGGYPGGGFRPQAQQIVCESWQFRPQQCPADTRGGVRLLQQTGGLCNQGQTWGYTPRGIWVTNGCRGIFAVVGGPPAGGFPPAPLPGRLIVCESFRFQPQRCATDVFRRPRIEVIAGNCIEGQTWGWDRGGVWVNGGCRARFLLG